MDFTDIDDEFLLLLSDILLLQELGSDRIVVALIKLVQNVALRDRGFPCVEGLRGGLAIRRSETQKVYSSNQKNADI